MSETTTTETPLCAVHKRVDENGNLEMQIGGNNCVACSLNERAELLDLLAPFAAKDGSEDSLTVPRNVAEVLRDANELCRSMLAVAQRQGLQTNWDALTKNLEDSLERQHKVMYPPAPAPAPQPALDAGEEWQLSVDGLTVFREPEGDSGYVPLFRSTYEPWMDSDLKTWPTKEQAQTLMRQIVANHRLAAAVPKLVEALKGVAIMLNTELEKYESEPWAQRVREALTTVNQNWRER